MRFKYGAIFLLCLLASSVAWADGEGMVNQQDLDHFFETKTYVVLDKDQMSDWNFKIPKAVKQSWDITPYEFINDDDFQRMRADNDKSFIIRMKVKFPGDRIKAPYVFMCVVLGSAVRDVTDLPEIVGIPLGYADVHQDSWGYKLESFLRVAQKHIKLMRANPAMLSANPLEYYNRNMSNVKEGKKELWVVERDLEDQVRKLADIRKAYDGVVKIVTPDDIEKAISDRREDVVFLHKVGPEGTARKSRIYKALVGAGDDKFYYFDYHNYTKWRGDGFLKRDFRRLNRR